MLQKYKEMFYGGIFGFGVSIIDTVMDARIEGLSFLDEMVQHRSMMIYRSVFILLGLAFGWLLWQKNKRERELRDLSEIQTISPRIRRPRSSDAHKATDTVNSKRFASRR